MAAMVAAARHHHHHNLHHLMQLQEDPICSSQGCYTDHYKDESKVDPQLIVPNFGVDEDIVATSEHLADAEDALNHKWIPDLSKPKPPPTDYFVPNFGTDHEILENANSLKVAEKMHGHKWNWQLKPKKFFDHDKGVSEYQKSIVNGNPMDVLDEDVKTTLGHVNDAEKSLEVVFNPENL